jgi:hypothetical protein
MAPNNAAVPEVARKRRRVRPGRDVLRVISVVVLWFVVWDEGFDRLRVPAGAPGRRAFRQQKSRGLTGALDKRTLSDSGGGYGSLVGPVLTFQAPCQLRDIRE